MLKEKILAYQKCITESANPECKIMDKQYPTIVSTIIKKLGFKNFNKQFKFKTDPNWDFILQNISYPISFDALLLFFPEEAVTPQILLIEQKNKIIVMYMQTTYLENENYIGLDIHSMLEDTRKKEVSKEDYFQKLIKINKRVAYSQLLDKIKPLNKYIRENLEFKSWEIEGKNIFEHNRIVKYRGLSIYHPSGIYFTHYYLILVLDK